MASRVWATAGFVTAGLAVAGFGVSTGQAAGEDGVSRTEVMAKSCLACHGAQGQGPGHMPAINDFTAEGIVNKLMTYRENGDPDATVMQRHAAAYTEDEIRAIAEYIANLSN